MSITLYVLLHNNMDIEEYLGVFLDPDSAKEHASKVALRRQNAELGLWESYGENAVYAETQRDEWYPAVYVIQAETIALNTLGYASYDQAFGA